MTDTRDVFGTTGKFHHRHALGDQLRRARPDDMHGQQAIRPRVGNYLDESLGFIHAACPRIGAESKAADAILTAAGLDLFLRRSDAGHFRPSVNHARHRVVIDVRLHTFETLDAGNAVFLGLVRQHRPGDEIADGVDTLDVRLEVFIHREAAGALVGMETDFTQSQSHGVRSATDGHKYLVALEEIVL